MALTGNGHPTIGNAVASGTFACRLYLPVNLELAPGLGLGGIGLSGKFIAIYQQ